MVAADYINLKSLTLDELVGTVSLYPWFGAARKELCLRMSRLGGSDWGDAQYADAALYVGDRRRISDIVRASRRPDFSDKDLKALLKSFIAPETAPDAGTEAPRGVRVVGGDYFSQAEYDRVRKGEDAVFSRFAAQKAPVPAAEGAPAEIEDRFCTETLAQIFAEQGYFEQAKSIYSRLGLFYPEKSAYFAALIENLD